MKKFIKIIAVLLMILCLSIFAFSCKGNEKTKVQVLDERFDLTNRVLNFINENYYDDLNYDDADLWTAYGLISSLGEYNYIYTPADLLGNATDGKGFGLIIRNTVYNEHLIDFILPGSPFLQESNGQTPARGDEIYAINDQRVSGLTSSDFSIVTSALNSDEDTKFTLLRYGATFEVTYRKVAFNFPYCIYINNLPGVSSDFGYIYLRTFDNSTNVQAEFEAAVASFNRDGNRALILDLRGNGGGSSLVLRQIASALIGNVQRNEPLVEVHYAKEDRSVYITAAEVANKIDTPIYVLCDGATASASEALIGTMKAHGTLTALIGTPTVGKGVAQNGFTTFDENDKGIFIDKGKDENGEEVDLDTILVQIIVGKYYIFDSSVEGGKYCIHGNPFTPDILIEGQNVISPDYSEDLYIHAAIQHYNG